MGLLGLLEYATNVTKQLLKLSIFTLLLFCIGYCTYKWVTPKDQLQQVEKKVMPQDEAVGFYSKRDEAAEVYVAIVAGAEIEAENVCKQFIRTCGTGWCDSHVNRVGKSMCTVAAELKQIKQEEHLGSEGWMKRTAHALTPMWAEACRHQRRMNNPNAAATCAEYRSLKNYASTMGVEI